MLGPIDEGWGVSGWARGIIGAIVFIPAIIVALLVNAYPSAYTIGYGVGILIGAFVVFYLLNFATQAAISRVAG